MRSRQTADSVPYTLVHSLSVRGSEVETTPFLAGRRKVGATLLNLRLPGGDPEMFFWKFGEAYDELLGGVLREVPTRLATCTGDITDFRAI